MKWNSRFFQTAGSVKKSVWRNLREKKCRKKTEQNFVKVRVPTDQHKSGQKRFKNEAFTHNISKHFCIIFSDIFSKLTFFKTIRWFAQVSWNRLIKVFV